MGIFRTVAMFRFIGRIFGGRSARPEPGSSPQERWLADFSSIEASRFEPVDEERYASSVDSSALVLALRKDNLFAWTDAGSYRYSDASITARFELGQSDAKRSAGLIIRKADDNSFVYILVSSDAEIRLDVVFNGEPRTLVPWVACPWAAGSMEFVLDVVARGSRFTAMLNGKFALEAEDDGLDSGGIAFAAQSYAKPATCRLVSLRVESRPMEVEVDYLRFSRVVAADADQRRRLAEGLSVLGSYVPAIVQLRKIAARGEALARDRFMVAECLVRLAMLDDAAAEIDACLSLEPTMEEAIEERYNLLYLRGRYAELKEALESAPGRVAASPRLANLLGHAYYNEGSWRKAADAYGRAASNDSAMPIYAHNTAMALEKCGDLPAASGAWLAAAKGFYAQQAWDDAEDCSRRLRELGFDKATLDSIDALVAYGRGDTQQSWSILSRLAKKGFPEAAAAYVYGVLLTGRNKRIESIKAFRRAVELEPSMPIYRYRLAESLWLSGQPCQTELAAALEAAPLDGWTMNLAGQVALQDGDVQGAADSFRQATQALPDEYVPAVNLSEALQRLGEPLQAKDILGTWPSRSAAAANQLGTILATVGDIEAASEAYRNACALNSREPFVADYHTNLAAALIQLEDYAEAENALRTVLELGDDPRAMMLMGDVCSAYGDAARTELSYRSALELEPDNALVIDRLARHYLSRRQHTLARQLAERLQPLDHYASDAIIAAIRAATTETISCASCGLSWDVPRPTPVVPRSRLRGEPPDDSPAGSCPDCGKTFCVACRKDDLRDGRFTCPDCGVTLNLNDDRVRWIVLDRIRSSAD